MAAITIELQRTYEAPSAAVFAALSDYTSIRPTILAPEFTDYQVLAGGTGAGTRISYHLHATKKRVRQVNADVTEPEPGVELLESDRNSTLTVLWRVSPGEPDRTQVSVTVSWLGAGGVGGFFERRFAPAGIRRIYSTELDRLNTALA